MASPAVPKYQAIYTSLRQQILEGELAAGSQLPPQQELADRFGVTLMTLRQAVSSLESDGLVWAARGKGTFVADSPVDISVGNLSSFAKQMRSAGVHLETEVLAVGAKKHDAAETALGVEGPVSFIVRRRRTEGVPISLQYSYFAGATSLDPSSVGTGSLYDAIEAASGWTVAEAKETIGAVALNAEEAALLDTGDDHPALRSVRVSINQFGHPFLFDEALLVGGRCSIAANRTSDRLSLTYGSAP